MPPKLLDGTGLCFQQENPKRKGAKSHERYEQYKAAATVGEALRLGASKLDIQNDVKQGFCVLSGEGSVAQGVGRPARPPAPPRKRAPEVAGADADAAKRQRAPPSPQQAARPQAIAIDLDAEDEPVVAAVPAAAAPAPAPAAAPAAPAAAATPAAPPVSGTTAAASSSSAATARPRYDDVDLGFAKLEGKPLKYVKRAMGEARRLLSEHGREEAKKSGYEFSLKDRDNLSKWFVKLSDLNKDGQLAKDLKRFKLEESVDLELSLPDGFPLEPPFARILYPQLAGGYVFAHGGICFEPLTAKGWAPSMTLPSLAIAIKGILDYGDVRVAGVGNREARSVKQYTEEGARKDHQHIVTAHRGGEGSTYGALKHYAS